MSYFYFKIGVNLFKLNTPVYLTNNSQEKFHNCPEPIWFFMKYIVKHEKSKRHVYFYVR